VRHGKIGITQPRRIAATAIATFVAEQLKCPLGSYVGYKVRFCDKESRETKIKFMTDGILLRELEHDRLLKAYDAIIIDEAHERSLNIDFLIGYMRSILPKRPHLRLILSSATINTRMFAHAFNGAPVISVSGRLYPVEISYRPPAYNDRESDTDKDAESDYVSAAAVAVEEIVELLPEGDILVFFPTERDIMEAKDLLEKRMNGRCHILPLFGRMPLSEQKLIFRKMDKQKIVLTTNIAETSLTVPDIRYVVDTGLARIKRYDPAMRITRLPVEPISQASAQQRAGRCGRVQDGICVRLYSEDDLLSRPVYTPPEIHRANLGQVILSMASLRLGQVEKFPFLEPPPSRAVSQGYSSLYELGAIDEEKNLTLLGRDMARFPLDPPLSRMIIEARKENCLDRMLIIAAGLCVQEMRVRPAEKKNEADAAHARFTDPMSDFLFYLKLWDGAGLRKEMSQTRLRKFCKVHFLSFHRIREWQEVYGQLAASIRPEGAFKTDTQTVTYEQIHRSIIAGFISQIAKKTEAGDYRVAKGRTAYLFPGSALYKKKPEWVVVAELVETSRLYSRTAASIDPAWLETLGGHLCRRSYSEPAFDADTGTVKAKEKVMLFGLPIIENRTVGYGRINPTVANEIFIRDGLAQGLLRLHHGFYRHNQELLSRIISLEKKFRSFSLFDIEETTVSFYMSRQCRIMKKNGIFFLMKLSSIIEDNFSRKKIPFFFIIRQ
jgi:ATP-dependent helicase HrpA